MNDKNDAVKITVKAEFPPNIEEIKKTFDIKDHEVFFAYYPHIYNPLNVQIPLPIFAHEYVHLERQKDMGVELWWAYYLNDVKFRFEEELLAHREEYKAYSKLLNANRAMRRRALTGIAKRLSGNLYGKMVSYAEARELIKADD